VAQSIGRHHDFAGLRNVSGLSRWSCATQHPGPLIRTCYRLHMTSYRSPKKRAWHQMKLIVGSLFLAAGVGALSEIVFWEPPPSWWWGDSEDVKIGLRSLFYIAVLLMLGGAALLVRQGLKARSVLEPMTSTDDVGRVDILALCVSTQKTEENGWQAGSLCRITSSNRGVRVQITGDTTNTFETRTLEPTMDRATAVSELAGLVAKSNWGPQMSLLAKSLAEEKLKAVIFIVSPESKIQLENQLLPWLENLLTPEPSILTRTCLVNVYNLEDCYNKIDEALESVRSEVARKHGDRNARRVVLDANGGTSPLSIASALVSMKERQFLAYKDFKRPHRMYDMRVARNSPVIPGVDA
jgi:hypothetical protein